MSRRMPDADFRRIVDEIRDRHRLSDLIRPRTALKPAGKELVGLCLFHAERSPSMRVNDAKGQYHCFGCGAHGDAIRLLIDADGMSFMDALRTLSAADLPIYDEADRIKAAIENAADRAQAVADAAYWWGQCVPAAGTAAEVYAQSRGIVAPLPDTIRFGKVPGWRRSDSNEWSNPLPAMVGACVDASDNLVAIQRIFLRNGGAAKAAMKKPKKTLGRIKGAALRLGPPARHVVVCEGPEDGLTLMQALPGETVWVALGTALMAAMEFPAIVEEVTLAGDNNPAGRAAVVKAGEALAARGLTVRTMFPAEGFADWNDELRGIRA